MLLASRHGRDCLEDAVIRVGRLKVSVTVECTLDLMIYYVKFQNFVRLVQGFRVPYIHEKCF